MTVGCRDGSRRGVLWIALESINLRVFTGYNASSGSRDSGTAAVKLKPSTFEEAGRGTSATGFWAQTVPSARRRLHSATHSNQNAWCRVDSFGARERSLPYENSRKEVLCWLAL